MKSIFIALMVAGLVSGCGGSGGNGSGSAGYTHNELAGLFISQLNLSSSTRFELVKSNTLQYNYIVIYDYGYDTYDAINLANFKPGDDPIEYLNNNTNYIDLDVLPGYYDSSYQYDFWCDCFYYESYWVPTRYRDRYTGVVFEKTSPTPKDRLTVAAIEEAYSVKKAASALNAKFGMSQERSFEVAELAVIWKNAPKDRMTDADHDEFAKSILGHSITEYKAAVEAQMAGNSSDLNQLIEDSATMNGLSPEKANQIINNLFGMDLAAGDLE